MGTLAHLVNKPNNKRIAPPASASITSQAKKVGKIKFKLSDPPGPKNSANLAEFQKITKIRFGLMPLYSFPQRI